MDSKKRKSKPFVPHNRNDKVKVSGSKSSMGHEDHATASRHPNQVLESKNPNNTEMSTLSTQDRQLLATPNDHRNEKESVESRISNFQIFRSFGATIFYIIFNLMRFFDSIIYQPVNNILHYKLICLIYFLSAFVTLCFSFNINIFKRTNNQQGIPNFRRLGALIGAFFTIEIFHVFFRLIFGKGIYDIHEISIIIFGHSLTTIPIFIIFQLFTLEVYVLVPYYTIKSLKSPHHEERQHYYNLLTESQADVGLLGILDGAFRTVPLQIVQIAIFLKHNYNPEDISHFEEVGILLSFFAMAWCSTSYQSSLRMHLPNKQDMDFRSMTWYSIWNFLICFSRTLCFGALASLSPFTAASVALVHCVTWGIWLWWSHPPLNFCHNNRYCHVLFCSVISIVYFMFPINLDNKPTKIRYCVFYFVMFSENFFAILFWYRYEQVAPWNYIVLLLAISTSVLGVAFLILYYAFFHPNKDLGKNISRPVLNNEVSSDNN